MNVFLSFKVTSTPLSFFAFETRLKSGKNSEFYKDFVEILRGSMKGIRRIAVFDVKQDAAVGQSTSLENAEKTGYLHTFSNKTFLSREKWKKRYYVLTGSQLYRFVKKEDASLESSAASRRRLINLDSYDICQHVHQSEIKREHVFILDGANSSVDQTKYVFAADTKEEMQEWISHLRKAIIGLRGSGRPQRPPRSKVSSQSSSGTQKSDGDASSEPHTPTRLYNATKYRVRGPRGRRLPQKKSRQFRDSNDKFISNSLCELDGSLSDEEIARPSPIRRSGAHSPPLGDRARSNSSGHLAYQYSSSDDSLLWKERATRMSLAEKPDPKDVVIAQIEEEQDSKNRMPIDTLEKDGSADKTPKNHEETVYVAALDNLSSSSENERHAPVDLEADEESRNKKSVGPLIYLSAKLLEMSGCLDRFQRRTKEELHTVKEHLADMKRKLTEYPPGTTPVNVVASKATLIMMDLKSTEEDLETLVSVTSRIQKSLQQVKERCDEMLNTV